ncbi:MAG: hypothetical protein H7641_12440 [Candidatus Heimdallarchaeota archaeon]|nr:hypothetical protein [Candidatus Heimdallarchaeota archaeon]MCK4878368.1 hypothetical protein [Candidatus Heimdallarchaeota archaeon]
MSFVYLQEYMPEVGKVKEHDAKILEGFKLADSFNERYPDTPFKGNAFARWWGPPVRLISTNFEDFNQFQEYFKNADEDTEMKTWNEDFNKFIDPYSWSAEFWGEFKPEGKREYQFEINENKVWNVQSFLVEREHFEDFDEFCINYLIKGEEWLKSIPDLSNIQVRYFAKWYGPIGKRAIIIELQSIQQLFDANKLLFEDEELAKLNKELNSKINQRSFLSEFWSLFKRLEEE